MQNHFCHNSYFPKLTQDDLIKVGMDLVYFLGADVLDKVFEISPYLLNIMLNRMNELESEYKVIASKINPELIDDNTSTTLKSDPTALQSFFDRYKTIQDKQKLLRRN